MKSKIRFTIKGLLILLMIVGWVYFRVVSPGLPSYYGNEYIPGYMYDPPGLKMGNVTRKPTPENIVGFVDYVFVAKVNRRVDTFYYKNWGFHSHLTAYSIEVIENIKGNLTTEKPIIVYNAGGKVRNNTYTRYSGEFLTGGNNYYILLACVTVDGSLLLNNEIIFGLDYEGISYEEISNTKSYKRILKAYENENTFEKERYKTKYEQ